MRHIVYVTKTLTAQLEVEFDDPDGDEAAEEALYEHVYQEASNLREADWLFDGMRLEIEGG